MAAPPAKPVTEKRKASWEKFLADETHLKRIKESSNKSTFFDTGAPSTVRRRQRTRADFEQFVKLAHGSTDAWNIATVIPWSKQYLTGLIAISKDKLGDKPMAGVLWAGKDDLYWWTVRFIDGFSAIFQDWQSQLESHIHYIAIQEQLPSHHREKNNLTDAELGLFFQEVMRTTHGVLNIKQHYVAWVLAYITGARPGSFTVSHGYKKATSWADQT
ncbi:hypothetical protein EJ04DRAFT_553107 [Polyplosphaeria fusca]|uniref:Uncharacterized protein n=1 Tax=Polyplosphaeria fusca TaxID=682080 RepID=A0A9P4QU12_9PLEO|nr:hypothetical protein EJ04DRAFT_553107 [Polyplosphaeria fusca]